MKDRRATKAYCSFCGSPVGLDSDRTGGIVTAIYDCPRCMCNYCDQCSYAATVAAQEPVQKCLRCDSTMARVE